MANSRPNADRVARRLLVLKCLIVHALAAPPREMLKEWMQKWSPQEREEFHARARDRDKEIWDNLKSVGLWDELSPSERAFSEKTIADMGHQDQVDFCWRMEAAVVLVWAMRIVEELPPLDELSDHDLLKLFPRQGVAEFIASARLRSDKQLDTARDNVELWHWRSRTRQLIEDGQHPTLEGPPTEELGLRTFDDIVRHTAKLSEKDGSLDRIMEGDFVAFGKPYRELDPEQWSTIRSATQERHFALNWLCGYAPDNRWDETPTDT